MDLLASIRLILRFVVFEIAHLLRRLRRDHNLREVISWLDQVELRLVRVVKIGDLFIADVDL